MHLEMEYPTKTLIFNINRKTPELITPAAPTPYKTKPLSDIDNQEGLRFHVPCISIYEGIPSMQGKDPADVIRRAIAKALVFYYPFAGRLREIAATRKLVVECTAEGILFVEADADVALREFGDDLHPPFSDNILDQLLYNVPGSDGITDSPLLRFQGPKIVRAGPAAVPTIPPVWERHLLSARRPPLICDVVTNSGGGTHITPDKMVRRSFLFSAAYISALRRTLHPLVNCSKFEIVAASAWRCRTIALALKPDDEIRFMSMTDIRLRMKPPLPEGYYGNAVVVPAVVTTVEKLSKNPLRYAVELVRKVKQQATDECVRSAAVGRDRAAADTYMVSDLTRGGFEQVDYGWGTAVYSGVAKGVADWILPQLHWYIAFKNKRGEQGIIVSVSLPLDAIEVFGKELRMMMTAAPTTSAL